MTVETILTIVGFLATLLTGIVLGGIAALRCVRFGIKAAFEVRNGGEGFSGDGVDAELEMVDTREARDDLDEN